MAENITQDNFENSTLIESLEKDIGQLEHNVKDAEYKQNEIKAQFDDKGSLINNIKQQIEQKDYNKDKTSKNIINISTKIKNIEMILGQSHQDLTTLYNALKELTRRSELVNKEKIRIQ